MNKKISLFALGAALIAVPVLAAPGGAAADADGNGTLTRTEAQAHAAQRFAKMDFNKDGKIDASDRAAKRAEMQAKKFASLDADGNGSISQAEWNDRGAGRAAKHAERAQKGAAAGETREGKRHAMRGHGKRGGQHGMHGGMMGKADINGDKAISQAEFQTAALARFDAADANKDGQVTAEERKAQRGEWRANRAAPAGR
jgi:Ca2+-binding EF-hand superfamily protein